MAGMLDGIKVLEVANWVAAPSACAMLADLGADVVKIEHPDTGDPVRSINVHSSG
ncbi:MAG: CoA transferase, partial [Chloroflexi bacterium]|nr:CoA transferase [Chloroflexota bacterium]